VVAPYTIEAPKAPRRVGCGEGVCQVNFSTFRLKMAIFGAFWAAIFTVQRTVLYSKVNGPKNEEAFASSCLNVVTAV